MKTGFVKDEAGIASPGTFNMWRVLLSVLVITVFAGIIMGYVSLFSSPSTRIAQVSKPAGEPELSKDMISSFRTRYALTITDPKAQVQVIEEIENVLKAQIPGTWQGGMYDAFKRIFPENAEQLMDMFKKLIRYNAWLDGSWGKLISMGRKERSDILLAKRHEIFGPGAEQIWADREKTETIFNVIDALNRVKNASLDDKLAFFLGTVRQSYGQEADGFIKSHQQELLQSFLMLKSVQEDLAGMQPEDRRQNLKVIRQVMGMDRGSLKRLDDLDKTRDGRWDKGLNYMKERQRILDTRGGDRERILDELRLKYFGNEASTVASEEKAGYYRFKVKRVYGLN